jgi:anti-sigma B factor antagonist
MSFPNALQRLTRNKLQISIRESGDVTILDLQGRATIGDGRFLLTAHLRKLVAKGVRKLLLNLADLAQLDSSGISPAVGTYVSLSRQGGSLKLVCPRGRVQDLLRDMRVADLIPSFEDETQALASFQLQRYAAA